MKKLILILLIVLGCTSIYAQAVPSEKNNDEKQIYYLVELLGGYLENDLDLQKLTLEVQKSQLSLKQTKIDQGFDVTLSTGPMTIYSGSTGTNIVVKPSVTAKLPSAKNLSASVSTDYQYKTSTNVNELKDTKFSAGIDLISQTEALSKINIMKSERLVLETKRKLQNTALTVEKKFYTELKDILNSINGILTSLQNVYTDRLNLEKLKAQGYSSASSTYRIAEMKVSSGEHDVETSIHNLKKSFVIFYQHCGYTIEFSDERNLLKYIPAEIPELEALNFADYKKENFSEIESAEWTYEINELVRKADKYFSFGINGGYTINNSTTKTDTVDAGISTTAGGLGLNCGVSIPIGIKDFTPAFSLSATVSPNSFRSKNITKQQYELTAKQELLDIQKAQQNYESALIASEQNAVNLNWEKNTVNENYKLYQQYEQDLKKYFNMGIVTESEWLAALNNRQLYEVKSVLNKLEFIIHNNNVKSQFVDRDDFVVVETVSD